MFADYIQKLKIIEEDRPLSVLAFLVFICPLAFSAYLFENFETPKYVLWLILIGWAMVLFVRDQKRVTNNKLLLLFSVWLSFGILSTLFSVNLLTSVFGFYYRFTSSLLFYGSFALFVIMLSTLFSQDKKKFIYQILVFDAVLVAVYGLFQSFGVLHYEGGDFSGLYRAPSFLGNPNFSSMFLVTVLPLALNFAFSATTLKQRIYYYSGVFLLAVSVLILASRGAVLAATLSLVFLLGAFFFVKASKKQAVKLFGIILVGFLLFFVIMSVVRPEGFFRVFKNPDTNTTLRLKLWGTVIQGIQKMPFLGEGPGNFHVFFEKTRGIDFANEQGVFDDAHNVFLQMAGTSGLPFALLFLGFLFYGCVLGFRKKIQDFGFGWNLAETSAIVGFVVAGSFNPVTVPCFLALAVVLSGLYSADLNQQAEGREKLKSLWKNIWFWLGVVLLYFGFALILAEFILGYGYRAYFSEQYQSSRQALKIANVLNPSHQLYELYVLGNGVKLKDPTVLSSGKIEGYVEKYGPGARVYVQGANLYYLLYRQTGNVDFVKKAIRVYEQALEEDPFFGERYGQMGIYYYVLSDFEKARYYAELSLKLKPDHIPTLVLLAKIYQQLDMHPEGLKVLEAAYRLSPENMQLKIWNYRGKYFKDLNKVGLEVQVYEGKLE